MRKKGGYNVLIELTGTEGPKWELVRMAAVVSLAGNVVALAECP